MSRRGRHDVDALVARIAPDPGPGLTPLARELLMEIVSTTGEPLPPAGAFAGVLPEGRPAWWCWARSPRC